MTDQIKAALEAGAAALAQSGNCAAIFSLNPWRCTDRPCLCEKAAASTFAAIVLALPGFRVPPEFGPSTKIMRYEMKALAAAVEAAARDESNMTPPSC